MSDLTTPASLTSLPRDWLGELIQWSTPLELQTLRLVDRKTLNEVILIFLEHKKAEPALDVDTFLNKSLCCLDKDSEIYTTVQKACSKMAAHLQSRKPFEENCSSRAAHFLEPRLESFVHSSQMPSTESSEKHQSPASNESSSNF